MSLKVGFIYAALSYPMGYDDESESPQSVSVLAVGYDKDRLVEECFKELDERFECEPDYERRLNEDEGSPAVEARLESDGEWTAYYIIDEVPVL